MSLHMDYTVVILDRSFSLSDCVGMREVGMKTLQSRDKTSIKLYLFSVDHFFQTKSKKKQ